MALTDYGAVSSQIGGGTVGQNSMRNFTDEMNMGSQSLMAMAKSKANKFQADALVEIAENGGTPAPTGGADWAGVAGSALKGVSGLFVAKAAAEPAWALAPMTLVLVSASAISALVVTTALEPSISVAALFSSGALDSIGSMGF